MRVHTWRSFSSNNSSAFRLVARFESAARADEVAVELRALFEELSAYDPDDEAPPSPAQRKLAERYGFDWPAGPLVETYDEDGFAVATHGTVLVVHHHYCLGGLESLSPYLRARGGETKSEEPRMPTVTARFTLPADEIAAARLYDAIETYLGLGDAQRDERRVAPWRAADPEVAPTGLPWEAQRDTVLFRIGRQVGLHLPIDAEEVDALRGYLEAAEVRDYRFTLCDDSQLESLQLLARLRGCPACGRAPIELHEAAIEGDLGEDQIACRGCGAMFALSNLEALLPSRRLGPWDIDALASAGETVYGLTAAWGVYGQVWRSDQGLESGFEQRVDQLAGPYLHLLALTPEIVLVCGTKRRVLRSVDGGKTWPLPRRRELPPGEQVLYRLVRGEGDHLFAVGEEGVILRSHDQGTHWRVLRAPRGDEPTLYDLLQADDGTLWAVGDGGTIVQSKDDGRSFRARKSGVDVRLSRIVTAEGSLLILGERGLLLASDDGGRSWARRARPTRADIVDLLSTGEQLLALTRRGALLASDDAGRSWRSESMHVGRPPRCLTRTASGRLVIGCEGGHVVEHAPWSRG